MKKLKVWFLTAALAAGVLMAGCGDKNTAETKESASQAAQESNESETAGSQVASADEMVTPEDVVEEGMEPIYGTSLKDGVYQVTVDSSSSMFKITECALTVKEGTMTAVMTMHGTGYLKLYMGTGEEATKASEEDYIPVVEASDGTHTFEVPVEALDMGIPCTAFSKKKEKWYDRILVFRADSLPQDAFEEGTVTTVEDLKLEDGLYTVEVQLGGGSGRASVESPAALRVEDGKAYATIVWSSSNYDYMKVNDEKFELISNEGNSSFEIPVSGFDWKMAVLADTTAMSTPHEIEYTLYFDSATIKKDEQ